MRWEIGRRSENVEDQRGFPGGGAGLGLGGVILLLIVSFFTGVSPLELFRAMQENAPPPAERVQPGANQPPDAAVDFVKVVLADTEDTWHQIFQRAGRDYREPKLVLFSSSVRSACGYASAAVGPFYCPSDEKVYLDLAFFDQLKRRFGAPGDFAQAYVIAHEVGHHVQNLLGISERISSLQQRASRQEANALSVKIELQADCLAGVWGHTANRERHLLEPGDVDEGLAAAAAVGDDRLQQQAQGYVVPESWTHGSSEMRVRWFKRGLESGDMNGCNTMNAELRPDKVRVKLERRVSLFQLPPEN